MTDALLKKHEELEVSFKDNMTLKLPAYPGRVELFLEHPEMSTEPAWAIMQDEVMAL